MTPERLAELQRYWGQRVEHPGRTRHNFDPIVCVCELLAEVERLQGGPVPPVHRWPFTPTDPLDKLQAVVNEALEVAKGAESQTAVVLSIEPGEDGQLGLSFQTGSHFDGTDIREALAGNIGLRE